MYMLNIFAIFSLLLAPIDGVIPLLFQSVHRFFFLCLYLSTKSACSSHKWAPLNELRAACLFWKPEAELSDPLVLVWTRLPLIFSFGLVCLSCFCLGFLGFFLLCASYSLLCHPSITGQSQCWCMYRFGQCVMNFELFSLCFLFKSPPPPPFSSSLFFLS